MLLCKRVFFLRRLAASRTSPLSRLRHASFDTRNNSERVIVPCGANGDITLDIFAPNGKYGAEVGPVILYLPQGPILRHSATSARSAQVKDDVLLPDALTAQTLARASASTVVQINYRLSPRYKFPVPLHDVLAGYDWVVNEVLLRNKDAAAPARQRAADSVDLPWDFHTSPLARHQDSVGVCGELFGGTLALSLALTECKLDTPARVTASAVNNPITDWIFPTLPPFTEPPTQLRDTEPPKKRRGRKSTPKPQDSWTAFGATPPLSASTLLAARRACFEAGRPADYFDAFASPILFLRTPGAAIPDSFYTPDPEEGWGLESLSSADFADEARETLTGTNVPSLGQPKPRKLPRKFPTTGMGPVRLPDVRLTVGAESALRDQGVEMVELLRRALVKYGDAAVALRGVSDGVVEGVLAGDSEDADSAERGKGMLAQVEEEVKRQIQLEVRSGTGLWCAPSDEPGQVAGDAAWTRDVEEVEKVGVWFRERLRRPR